MTKMVHGEERERKRGILCCDNIFLHKNKLVASKKTRNLSLPEVSQPCHKLCRNETKADDQNVREKKRQNDDPLRRHSWSSGINACGLDNTEMCRPRRKSSHDSRMGSSIASIPDIIEECSSDDEHASPGQDELGKKGNELRCRNCFQRDKTVLIVKTDKYPYCEKCRDLLRNKNKYGNMMPVTGVVSRKTNSIDCLSTPSPRRTRKTSLPESLDLPRIEEPLCGEEASDTIEMQLIVEKEVHNLIRFGSKRKGGKPYKHRRGNSDDLDLITVGFKNILIHNNTDFIQ